LREPTDRGVILFRDERPNFEAFDVELRPIKWFSPANPWPNRSQRILDLIEIDPMLKPVWKDIASRQVRLYQQYGHIYGCRGCIAPWFLMILGPAALLGITELAIGSWSGWIMYVNFVIMAIAFALILRWACKKRPQQQEKRSIEAAYVAQRNSEIEAARPKVVYFEGGFGMIIR
jgi:hypothetical protein